MSISALPEGIDGDDEIVVLWKTDEDGNTEVTSQLGGAKVVITTDEESVHLVPWLVASAPQVLDAAWSQIEAQNTTQ